MGKNRKKPVRHRLEKRQKRSRQKKKSGLFDKVTMVVLVVAVCVFAFSLYQLVRTMVPYYSGGKEYDKLKNKAITVQEQTDDPGDVSGDTFKVDFDVLLQENPDTVAWIRFDEPSIISYPVVKSADNKEYLTKTFSANDNKLGAIFMDMKNKSDFSDRNTPDGKTRTYTVFSAAVVKDTADQYNLTYATDEAFESYLKMCKEDSAYDTGTEVNAQSQIVSLSTCTNVREDERFLLQGVLTATDGGEN